MRTATIILLVGMTVMLLSCGLADGGQKAADSEGGATSVTPGTPPGMVTPLSTSHDGPTSAEREQVSEDSEAGASSQATVMGSSVAPPAGSMIAYDGPTSLEERILKSPVIARVRLDSATSTVESRPYVPGNEVHQRSWSSASEFWST